MGLAGRIGAEILGLVLSAAPFILLGLVMAGALRALLPGDIILRWMGRRGLSGSLSAALLGAPLPVCSCGVVPIAAELRRKGASRPATLGFLITTPESSLDSVLLTWGLMGPVMAIARPVAALLTSLLAGVLQIAAGEQETGSEGGAAVDGSLEAGLAQRRDEACADERHASSCQQSCTGAEGGSAGCTLGSEDQGLELDARARLAGLGRWWRWLRGSVAARIGKGVRHRSAPAVLEDDAATQDPHRAREERQGSDSGGDPDTGGGHAQGAGAGAEPPARRPPGPWQLVIRPSLRFGCIDLLDQIAFWLVLGLVTAGLVAALVPADLAERGLGGGLLPMLLMVVVGVPLYMCASASTPIAAALVAKGLSPGAALVLLLTGPATNIASLILLRSLFGRRLVRLYLISVVAGAIGCGLLLDLALGVSGAQLIGAAALDAGLEPATRPLDWVCAAVLAALVGWRLAGGAWRAGAEDLRSGLRPMITAWARVRSVARPGYVGAVVLVVLAGLWLGSGLVAVPLDSQGFGFVLGELRVTAGPGLHWLPPWPVGRVEIRPVSRARKADVGFTASPELLRRRRELTAAADAGSWHSPVAAMNASPEQASYLAADENLVDLAFSVHYRLRDPERFLYSFDQGHRLVVLYAQAAAREVVASSQLDALLTGERRELETAIAERVQAGLDRIASGVEILKVHVVDVHPPQDAVYSFRDVCSAREDRETVIHHANETRAYVIPRARGDAEQLLAGARAEADRARALGAARAEAFSAETDAIGRLPRVLHHLLRLETLERALAGRKKLILPPGHDGPAVSVWQQLPPPALPQEVTR